MRGKLVNAVPILLALGCAFAAPPAAGQATVQSLVSAEQARIKQAQEAQDRIDAIVETTRDRFNQWQAELKEIEGLRVYNAVQERLIADQEAQLADLRTSIDQVTVIERQILPLMTRMIDGLERFIALDVPFLLDERKARVEELKELLTRSDVTAAEKFRKVMEAWQIENDYGEFPEAYTGVVEIDGQSREVNLMKIGRVALLYLTPDAQRAGAWDQRTRRWVPLSSDYCEQIAAGLRYIKGADTPALFTIPIAPPEEG